MGTMSKCPCQSGKPLNDCCEPFIKGKAIPKTAEALMRSRYTAFALQDMDYVEKTTDPDKLSDFDKEASVKWASQSEWTGLEVKAVEKGGEKDHHGIVEFIAHFKINGIDHQHHEVSEFHQHDGRWYFFDGKLVQAPFVKAEPKIGRNDPCPCGSGKKFKKCCAA